MTTKPAYFLSRGSSDSFRTARKVQPFSSNDGFLCHPTRPVGVQHEYLVSYTYLSLSRGLFTELELSGYRLGLPLLRPDK